MGSSSKKSDKRVAQTKQGQPGVPDAVQKGPGGFANPSGVNRYFSDPALLPADGGLVRPETGPGGPAQGIGLNWMMPQPVARPLRDTLAEQMAAVTSGISRPGAVRLRSQGDRGGSHGGFAGSQGAGGFSGWAGGGPGNRGGGLY